MTEASPAARQLPVQAVRMRQVGKTFAAPSGPLVVLADFNLDIAQGEFAVLLGPSGCGKSTAIRLIAGLTLPSGGSVLVNGHPISGPGVDCGMVFQSYTSFPWLSVIENIAFGLRYSRPAAAAAEHREHARGLARLVGLESFENAYINRLSGGMKQRVALASALAKDPPILLMDEPFGALDSQTRMLMQEHLLGVVRQTHKTVIFVTHDIDEALMLADRIYVCSGRPARILEELEVPFAQPRLTTIRNEARFFEMKCEIFRLLRDDLYNDLMKASYERRRR
jgi:NitT/TauT family transport system ATP-binding protein